MDIQVAQIIYQLINFGIVVGALSYLLYGPIVKILDERSRKIEEGQKAASAAESARDKADVESKKVVQKAEKTAASIIEEAEQTKKEIIKKAEVEARGKAETAVENLKDEWQAEKKQHVADMKKSFLEAVTATASKVVSAELDSKKHKKLIDSELDSLLKTI